MEEDKKVFVILKRNENCVLLRRKRENRGDLYKVRDIENDDIYIGYSYDNALKVFTEYDIEEVKKKKRELFEQWLEEFAEA